MSLVTEEAIVLTRYPFRERSAVVVFLCRGRGLVRAIARQGQGRKGGGVALEPLARVRVSLFLSPRRELATVGEVVLEHSVLDLAARPRAWAAGLVAAELALELCPPGTVQESFFRLLERTVFWLERGIEPQLVVHYVVLWAAKLAGVLPDVACCGVGGEPLASGPAAFVEGTGFCCERHGSGGTELSLGSRRFLAAAVRLPLDKIEAFPGDELLPLLAALVQRFLEKPLRALTVYQKLAAIATAC